MPDMHDAGGKSRFKLPPGQTGGATFAGERDEFRTVLWRAWDEAALERNPIGAGYWFPLFVGMNPSTASVDMNDPTVCWETNRTREWGYRLYVKMNVMDYRATQPRDLLADHVRPRSAGNLEGIVNMARMEACRRVVLTFGCLPKPLRRYGEQVVRVLRNHGIKLWCIGTTADGSPRHPRGVSRDVTLIEYRG